MIKLFDIVIFIDQQKEYTILQEHRILNIQMIYFEYFYLKL